jgi:hypothetical protein
MYLTSKSYMGVMHPEPSSPPPFPLKVATALQVGGRTGWMDWLGADVNGIKKKKKKKASAYGVGAILSQEGKAPAGDPPKPSKPKLHPIAYYSATFTPMERNYDIYERELLAVIKALANWRPYLIWTETPFIVRMDHANLLHWKEPQNLNCRTARWHAVLQDYNFKIEHVPGKDHQAADALSRPPRR